MSSLSDFLGGGKPKLITRYTSGTGTYVPTVDNARCLVRIQGSGGGGAVLIAGGGGAYYEGIFVVPIAGTSYVVGAAGAGATGGSSTAGNFSRFGSIKAPGASTGYYSNSSNNGASYGGIFGQIAYRDSSYLYSLSSSSPITVAGGYGGVGASVGGAAGTPIGPEYASGSQIRWTYGGQAALSSVGTGTPGGGDSYSGIGGTGGGAAANGAAGSGYGAGGGGCVSGYTGGAGSGGFIEIWDFGV